MKEHRLVRYLLMGFLVVSGLLTAANTQAQKKDTFTPLHIAKLKYVISAEISPDGNQIAYILNVPRDLSKEKDGRAWTELHVVDTQGNSRPYVIGKVNVSGIAWTPGGTSISFLDKREGDENRSLYEIPLAGGEARKILEHSTNIGQYSWSPDGKQVAFLAAEPIPEKVQQLKDKGFSQEIYEEDLRPVKVWIVSLDSKEKPRALKLKGSASELHWSPDSKRLALALAPTPLVDHHYMFRKVRVVDAKTGKILQRLDNPGKIGPISWSPDGKYVALVSGEDKYDPREGRLWVARSRGVSWNDVLPNYQAHVAQIGWKDPNTILYLGNEGVWTSVGTVRIKANGKITGNKKVLIPTKGPILISMSVSKGGTALAFVGHTPKHPYEVFFLGPKDKEVRRLTNHNSWLKNMRFAKQEVETHEARDGLKLEGILVRPLDEKKGKRYPLVLTVHGGPESHVPMGWVTRYAYLGQVGAANGFAVFYPNYRGSTGRGVEFSMMGQKDAAGKEFDDLVDAVDHLVETGLVNKDKVGITGGSYGGYATAWSSTYYSDRFAAGVMFVGISDGISKVGTTDIPWEMYLVHHRKWLWEDWNYFLKSSPIYHIEKAKTPLLILHGKNDPRVHPGQSIELFRHLKIRKKSPVRLVFYPGEGHGNRRAASRLDYNFRLLRWMKHYLKGPGGAPPPTRIEYQLESK